LYAYVNPAMVPNAIIPRSIGLLKKISLLAYGTLKQRSKCGEDQSINDITDLSIDAGDWTSDIGD